MRFAPTKVHCPLKGVACLAALILNDITLESCFVLPKHITVSTLSPKECGGLGGAVFLLVKLDLI